MEVMLKSHSLKFISRMPFETRIWTRTDKTQSATGTLEVWDGGDIRFERFSDGVEKSWKIIERKKTETGFIETLELLDLWIVPTTPVWKEILPVTFSAFGFSIPGWNVKTK
jgi:hypothetical protein